MPEINEIRNYADFIRTHAKNKELRSIEFLGGRYETHGPFENYDKISKMLPLKILDVKTKGKLLYIIFDKSIYMLNTMGLAGGWVGRKTDSEKILFSKNIQDYSKYMPKDEITQFMKNALNHLNVGFVFDNITLFFHDSLSFGTIKVIEGVNELDKKLKTIGPDIMDNTTTFEVFKERVLLKKNLPKEIGVVLMEQNVISGIGNYLRADILYMSKISPFRKVKNLTNDELQTIYANCKTLTWGEYSHKKAIAMGYVNKSTKLPADYDRTFFIYGQDTDMFGNKVRKDESHVGGQKRFIYWVPKVQI